VSEVRELAGGFSIAKLEEIRPARLLEFHEVQSQIRETLLNQARAAALDAYVQQLRKKAQIEYLPAAAALGF